MFDTSLLLTRITDAARAEAQAAAARLVAIGELFRLRLAQHGNREEWAADTCDEVAAEIAAALSTSVAMGHSNLRYARAMHERLPQVAADEPHDPLRPLQLRHIQVAIHPVDRLQLEHHVISQHTAGAAG